MNEAEDCLENSEGVKEEVLLRRALEIQFEVKIKSAISHLEEAAFQLAIWRKELPLESLHWQEYEQQIQFSLAGAYLVYSKFDDSY